MTFASADLEADLFYAEHEYVYRRGLVEARETDNVPTGRSTEKTFVCVTFHGDRIAPDGTAEQIARALNRLPKAERLLVLAAQALRSGDVHQVNAIAETVEEWMVAGV